MTDHDIEFNIKVKMKDRRVSHFLAMLKHMQYLGGIGSSRKVSFYSDGDGMIIWIPMRNQLKKMLMEIVYMMRDKIFLTFE